MNEVRTFFNEEFGEIRTIILNDKVYFCGKDIANALGYKVAKDAISAHCKGAVKHRSLTNGGYQELNFITEGDVYRLIAHSRLPSAERFECWVFDKVLPTIRKTGGYVANEDVFVETYLPFADEPIKQLFRIQCRVINQLNEVRNGKFTDDIIKSSKLSIKESLTFTSPDDYCAWYSSQILYDTIRTPKETADNIEKVTREEICAAASRMSLDKIFMLVAEGAQEGNDEG